MKLRASALVLFALAGTVSATDDLCTLPLRERTEAPPGMHFAPRSEVNSLVYEITSPSDFTAAGNNRGTGGSAAVFNDGNFPTYPPAQGVTYPIAVNGFCHGWIGFGPAVAGQFDYQCTFFDNITSMTPQGVAAPFYSTVIGTFRQNAITPNWGFVEWFQNPLTLVDGAGNPVSFNFPDQNWGYEVKIFETGGNTLWAGAAHGGNSLNSVSQIVPLIRGGGGAAPATGTSSPNYFRNEPTTADATLGADSTILNDAGHSAGSVASRRDVYIKLRADIAPPTPPVFFDLATGVQNAAPVALDCATQGTVTATFTLNPAEARLYSFILAGDASVAANTYCDITTTTDGADTTMALYDVSGNRLVSNSDDGDLLNALLTFGHGRREAVGDSVQADGHNGDLVAGRYYLAVGGLGTTFGSSGFGVNPADSIESGNVSVVLTHNTGTTPCPLPPPVAPTAAAQGLLASGVTTVQVAGVGFGNVQWLTFDTDYSVSPGDTTKFLDITTAGSDANVVDSELGVYDNAGIFVASNDDACDGAAGTGLTVLSFADVGATAREAIGTCQATGQSGDNLPAGHYYLCVGLFDTVYGADGWQARSNSGSNLTVSVNFRTPAGCPVDFNADGNIDPDDLGDFITCFFGEAATPGTCPAADFNHDTNIDPDDLGDFITQYFGFQSTGVCQ